MRKLNVNWHWAGKGWCGEGGHWHLRFHSNLYSEPATPCDVYPGKKSCPRPPSGITSKGESGSSRISHVPSLTRDQLLFHGPDCSQEHHAAGLSIYALQTTRLRPTEVSPRGLHRGRPESQGPSQIPSRLPLSLPFGFRSNATFSEAFL